MAFEWNTDWETFTEDAFVAALADPSVLQMFVDAVNQRMQLFYQGGFGDPVIPAITVAEGDSAFKMQDFQSAHLGISGWGAVISYILLMGPPDGLLTATDNPQGFRM
jgi:hypothetical protein